MVRFSSLGRLDDGGDVRAVWAVLPLSFVGVLDEFSDPVLSPAGSKGCGSRVEVDAPCS